MTLRNMDSKSIRAKVLGLIGIVMLICMVLLGFFAVPIGLTVCSLIGVIYGFKYKDKPFRIYSYIFLVLGISVVVYTLFNIYSM